MTYKDYNDCPSFREYVNRFCISNHLTVEEALQHKVVKEYWNTLQKGEVNEIKQSILRR